MRTFCARFCVTIQIHTLSMLTFSCLFSNVIACSFRVLHYVATCMVNRQKIEHMLSRASTVIAVCYCSIIRCGGYRLRLAQHSRLRAAQRYSSQHGNQCLYGCAVVSTRTVRELNPCDVATIHQWCSCWNITAPDWTRETY